MVAAENHDTAISSGRVEIRETNGSPDGNSTFRRDFIQKLRSLFKNVFRTEDAPL
jgi:hypothetical protein